MNRIRQFLRVSLCCVSTFAFVGCGGNNATSGSNNSVPDSGANPATVDKAASNVESGNPPIGSTPGVSNSGQTRRQDERWTDANGVEYLGNVPLDVFFDQPLKVAGDQTMLGGGPALAQSGAPTPLGSGMTSPPMAAPAMDTTADTPASTDPPAEAAGSSWSEFISAEEIRAEITDSRNFLNRSLQRYGDYKKAMLMIPGKAAAIAVLAHIAMEHPEDVSWKEDAIYIRDLAKKMNEETLKPDKKSHERVLTLFENIASTLDRSRPADLEEPNAEDSYVDVAGMDMLMVRLDEAEKRLKTEAGSESAFESKKEMIKHEAALLGTLSRVITLEGYGYADDDEFKGYANNIVKAARTIRDSIDTNNFDSYELALSKVSTSCSDCHTDYRNN